MSICLCYLTSALDERFFHALELPRDAAVVDGAADPRDGAADDRLVDPRGYLHVAPGRPRQLIGQRSDTFGRERHGCHDLCPDNLLVIHQTVDERLRHVRHDCQPIPLRQQQKQFDNGRLYGAGPRNQLLDDRPLPRRGNGGVDQRALKRLVAGNDVRERAEVALGLDEVFALGLGHVEERPRVADGSAMTRHRATLSKKIPARSKKTPARSEQAPAGWSGAAGCWIIIDGIESSGKP